MKNFLVFLLIAGAFAAGYFVHSPLNETVDIPDSKTYPHNIVDDSAPRAHPATINMTDTNWSDNSKSQIISPPVEVEVEEPEATQPSESAGVVPSYAPTFDSSNNTMLIGGVIVLLVILFVLYKVYEGHKHRKSRRGVKHG